MSEDWVETAKAATGRRAADCVEDGMRVGLGTGSTVKHTIIALGERAPDVVCTATSVRSHELATEVGLRVVSPDEITHLDIAIDGADEVSADFYLTKGGGGAHTREKVVATMSDRFIVVVDERKLVDKLGAFGTPVEILPFAPEVTAAWIRDLGASEVAFRQRSSDNGNLLADARFGLIDDPAGLATALSAVPGLVEHGIFSKELVTEVMVAGRGGVSVLPAPHEGAGPQGGA
ncbi:MAG: Ribose-5-phosphate isomerase A [Acidimicrobiales bacterium]|nr:MAG: ribose-5-phosphate isomerase RpiA [Actinomycetota bacterium]MBV6508690.1 Ribose-5-phosphate isomerase A [Acidimicrobiales bacterium]RIK08127.1 MAG: ribose 5-phosphate isomerase A [Acidobacteriota bacterium]